MLGLFFVAESQREDYFFTPVELLFLYVLGACVCLVVVDKHIGYISLGVVYGAVSNPILAQGLAFGRDIHQFGNFVFL